MKELNGDICYTRILEIFHKETDRLSKYLDLRNLIEQICRQQTQNESVHFSNLFVRLNYLAQILKMPKNLSYRIHTFRIHANRAVHAAKIPDEATYMQDLLTIVEMIAFLYKMPPPNHVKMLLPEKINLVHKKAVRKKAIRAMVNKIDEVFIYATDQDHPDEDDLQIRYNVAGINDIFEATISQIWMGCMINILDNDIDPEGAIIPRFIVVEPDYLLDSSSLAETFRDYGHHPLNYILSRFMPKAGGSAIMLGNVANLIFDEVIYARDPENITPLRDILSRSFREDPFGYSTHQDFAGKANDATFYQQVKTQYDNIIRIVKEDFTGENYHIDNRKAILEPSFICEKLGIQGRMDYLEKDLQHLIELKSGRAVENGNIIKAKESNLMQLILYLGIMEYSLGKDHSTVKPFLLYSRYPKLCYENPSWNILKQIINLRNLIVANDFKMSTSEAYSERILTQITPEILNIRGLNRRFWEHYLKPPIEAFRNTIDKATPLERKWFYAWNTFITRENYLAKLQISHTDEDRDTSCWLDFNAKKEGGNMLWDLTLIDNASDKEDHPHIVLGLPENNDSCYLHNFRRGDIVAVYERNTPADNITNKQVFKGHITDIAESNITIGLRARQRNPDIISFGSLFAIEPDILDSGFSQMFRSIYAFLQTKQDRKNLLLGQQNRRPLRDQNIFLKEQHDEDVMECILHAKQAKDFYLLIGPPGTGKTSKALKGMVKEFLSEDGANILLLSFTNRAVDEICKTLKNMEHPPSFIRIGSSVSADPKYRENVLENLIKDVHNREEVKGLIQKCRVITGTVSSLAGKLNLFELKTFSHVIIDEASQILEPALIGILSAVNSKKELAIGKCIMIGDHRQLPAVVVQSEKYSLVQDTDLHITGLYDRRNSLFERLYNLWREQEGIIGMLYRQGRMHPEIACFPGIHFYENKLKSVQLPHQTLPLPYNNHMTKDKLESFLTTRRIGFCPSETKTSEEGAKYNQDEATIITRILSTLNTISLRHGIKLTGKEHAAPGEMTVGIIATYRKQIALIRQMLEKNLPDLAKDILIDTVERYQGSERDVILYSFCVNSFQQLGSVSSTFTCENQLVDRKLNVAMTRARQQLFLTGNPFFLEKQAVFKNLLDFLQKQNACLNDHL